MTITKRQSEEELVLEVEGRLDTTTAPQLETELLSSFDGAKHVRLDLKNVTYLSSAALRILLKGEKTAKAKDGTLTVANVPPSVLEIFDMTGFSSLLTIVK
ncbi:MAG: STAS domain-containing protein [Synergistaceae bacterium]|jgi:anti-anti-sigma factor|nr:STAS domain-containing protein [Synergistaceae bacterium]